MKGNSNVKYYEWQELPIGINSQADGHAFISKLKEIDFENLQANMIMVSLDFGNIVEINATTEDGALEKYFFNGNRPEYYKITSAEVKRHLDKMSESLLIEPDYENEADETKRKLLLAWKIFMEYDPCWEREVELWGKMTSENVACLIVIGAAICSPLVKGVKINIKDEELESEFYSNLNEVDVKEYVNLKYW